MKTLHFESRFYQENSISSIILLENFFPVINEYCKIPQ